MSSNLLQQFREAKQPEVDFLHSEFAAGRIPAKYMGERKPFGPTLKAKGPGAVIAEFKQASPSMGDINLDLTAHEAADIFAGEGAAAMSVLTEEKFFKGSVDFLIEAAGAGLPMLRKDFIFDPLQVAFTASSPAAAFLLVVRMFEDVSELAPLIEIGKVAGLEAVVEIFDEADLRMAREAGAQIIQVNSRDLDTLDVDPANQKRLIAEKGNGEIWIAASGIKGPEQVREMAELGYEAVLVGTSIMQAENIGAALRELTEAVK